MSNVPLRDQLRAAMSWLASDPRRLTAAVACLLGALAIGLTVTFSDVDGDGDIDRVTIERKFKTIATPPGAPPVVADTDQQMERDEQREAAHVPAAGGNPDLHEDTRDETPPGVSPAQLERGRDVSDKLADEILVTPVKPGGAQAYSCPAAYVRNLSALSGKRVGTALHFTVSSPGSLNVIRGLFDRPSFGASSNFGIELTGRCQTWVPRSRKAWAQGAANSAYFSIEIVTRDLTRAQWLAAPIIKRGILAALVRDLNMSVGAPLKHVNPVGCAWTPGITDHNALECGNTHWDVGHNFPWDVFMKQVRQGVEPTAADKSTCRKINSWRRAGKPYGGQWAKNTDRRAAALRARGVKCLKAGPVKV